MIHVFQYIIGIIDIIVWLVAIITASIPKNIYPGYFGDIKISLDQLYQLSNVFSFIGVGLHLIIGYLFIIRKD